MKYFILMFIVVFCGCESGNKSNQVTQFSDDSASSDDVQQDNNCYTKSGTYISHASVDNALTNCQWDMTQLLNQYTNVTVTIYNKNNLCGSSETSSQIEYSGQLCDTVYAVTTQYLENNPIQTLQGTTTCKDNTSCIFRIDISYVN